ncbi:MAG: hypothetical protein F4035_00080 [Acidimicrobiia bacterium]|nr:hypothetical protein [Acidimicrobiia bacterium]
MTESTHQTEGTRLIPGQVQSPTIADLPLGFTYGVTRYADVILREAFPARFIDIREALEGFQPTLDELRAAGGGRTVFVGRFDDSLRNKLDGDRQVWGKQKIAIERRIELSGGSKWAGSERSHEIDMFGFGSSSTPLPGVAVEMEWNNKDPFFDRDLNLFEALHRETAIAVGVIVTRGPRLQNLVGGVVRSKDGGFKYGQSSTHWDKLVPKVNLGGGGECPLLLIGIEPERIKGIDLAQRVRKKLDQADDFKANWRETHKRWQDAKPEYDRLRREALALMPPV